MPRFFGDPGQWDAPATDGVTFQPAPVGSPCGYECGRPIEEGDTGILVPYLGVAEQGEMAVHRSCFMSWIGFPVS